MVLVFFCLVFGVWCLSIGILEFGYSGLGFCLGNWSLIFRVENFGVWVSSLGIWSSDFGILNLWFFHGFVVSEVWG